MNCLFCKHRDLEIISPVVRDSAKHSVTRCKKCGLYQLNPIPSTEEEEEFYNQGQQFKNIDEPTQLNRLRNNQKADTIRRADFVSSNFRKSSILDIGSGFGFFLEEMEKRGFNPTGIEVSAFARNIAHKVTTAQILNIDLFNTHHNKKYDIITLFHVLEHISEPVEFLKVIQSYLNHHGKLIIEVPNRDDLMIQSNKAYRQFYWQRAHILYLNPFSLSKLLKAAGYVNFRTYFIHRYGLVNFMHWMIRNKPQIKKPSFSTHKNYQWLEKIYKNILIKGGISDTLMTVVDK